MAPSRFPGLVTDDFTRVFEQLWVEFRARWCASRDLGGARAFHHDHVKIPMLHRVVQIDAEPGDADRLIDAALRHFRDKAFDCAFTLTPLDRPADLGGRLLQRGFDLAIQATAMLCDRPAEPLRAPEVEVVVPGAGEFGPWAEVWCRSFDLPLEAGELGRTVLDIPRVRLYLARRGGEPAGTALLYSDHGMGYVDLVGTLPGHRRQGVASALVARAVDDSRALGNRWTSLETEPDSGAERVYRRRGFRRMHLRPRYVRAAG